MNLAAHIWSGPRRPAEVVRAAIALAVAAVLAGPDHVTAPADLSMFAERGSAILSGHLSAVYSDSWNQTGPLQLLLSRLLVMGGDDGQAGLLPVLIFNVVVMGLVLLRLRILERERTSSMVALGAIVLTILWLTPGGLWYAHPVELGAGLLWWAAAEKIRSGCWLVGGVGIGVSIMIAPWAVLAIPLVLLAPTRRSSLNAAAVALGIGILAYVPFAVAGPFRLFDHVWPIQPGTIPHLLFPGLAHADWQLRIGQAVVVTTIVGYLTWRTRTRPAATWLVPLVVVLGRALTDPVWFGYYLLPAVGLVLVGLTAPVSNRSRITVGLYLLLGYLSFVAAATRSFHVPVCAVAFVVVVVLAQHSRTSLGPTVLKSRAAITNRVFAWTTAGMRARQTEPS